MKFVKKNLNVLSFPSESAKEELIMFIKIHTLIMSNESRWHESTEATSALHIARGKLSSEHTDL